ncbi:MAG: PAS domain S-box protein [Bacteroidales bacterium]|nr:PAS domain S-box protein [Bacteroidales bacterium]
MKINSKMGIVLIVEDMLENLRILSQLLKKQGYEIYSVETGQEALDFVAKQSPDLILLDIVLPDIDGFEVCSRLKNDSLTEAIPIIFISALTNTEDILTGFAVGGVDYITKPFIAEQVLARVSTHLKMSNMRNQLLKQTSELKQVNSEILSQGKAEIQEKVNELRQLSQATSVLLEMDSKEAIYHYIEKFIYPLSGADYFMIVGYDKETQMTYAEEIFGIDSFAKQIVSFLGKDFKGKQISTHDWVTRLSLNERKNIYKLEQGLYELTEHTLSRAVCFGLEKLLGLKDLFSIGFIWDKKFYGGVSFGFKKGNQFKKRSLVESILHQISMALSRIESKEQLKLSEEKYRSIFDHTGNATMIVDDKANIILVNDKCFGITGYSPKQLTGTRWTQYVAPESLQGLKEYSINRLENPKAINKIFEANLIDAKGQKRIVQLSVGLIPESNHSVVSLLDITALKNAQTEVIKNEQKYRSIFENIQDVYFETKMDGTIIELSPSIHLLSKNQYKREDLLGLSLYDFYRSGNGRFAILERLKNKERVHDFEIELINKDGSIVICSLSANIHLDPIGKFPKIVGTFHDITDRKKAEKQLIESERQYKDLVEKGNVGIGIDDVDGKIVYVNKQFLELFGYTEKEVIGKGHAFFLHPDEIERVSELHKKRILGNKMPNRYEVKALRKDGAEIYIEIDVTEIFKDKGEVKGTISYLWDITDRKKSEELVKSSEEKFNTAFDMAPVAMTLQNKDGVFLEVNQAFVELMGYSKDETIGQSAKALRLWADKEERKRALTLFKKQGFLNAFEFEFRKKSGEIGIGINSTELIALGNNPAELTTVLDITDRKNAEEKVLKLSRA